MRRPTARLFVTCASSGATSRWAMRVNSSSQLSTSTTSEARLDLTAHPRLAPRASRQSGVCSLAVPFGGHNPPPWASSPGAAGAPFLTERPVWSAASSNANGEDGREAGVDGSPLASGVLVFCLLLVGAAMCSAFDAAFTCAAGHNAFRAGQVPTISSHSKCNGQNGFS